MSCYLMGRSVLVVATSVRTPHPPRPLPGYLARCGTFWTIRSQPRCVSESGTSEANGTVRVQVPVLTSRLSLPSAAPVAARRHLLRAANGRQSRSVMVATCSQFGHDGGCVQEGRH